MFNVGEFSFMPLIKDISIHSDLKIVHRRAELHPNIFMDNYFADDISVK